MNTATAVSTYVFGAGVVVLIALAIGRMSRGWRHRADLQADRIGSLPEVPAELGEPVAPAVRGLYLGSTLAPDWLDRINFGDLGFRAAAVLTRYDGGILLERSGAGRIWMPRESVVGVRTAGALAGKVIPGRGVLVVRWRLPSGTEIDSGFRGDSGQDCRYEDYTQWMGEPA